MGGIGVVVPPPLHPPDHRVLPTEELVRAAIRRRIRAIKAHLVRTKVVVEAIGPRRSVQALATPIVVGLKGGHAALEEIRSRAAVVAHHEYDVVLVSIGA